MAWPLISLPDCLVTHRVGRANQINASEIRPTGQFAVVDQGQEPIAGYTDEAERAVESGLPYVIFGDHTRCLKYVDFPFVLGADGTKVLKPKADLFDARFFYFAALALDIPSRGYNRHFTLLKKKSIPRPQLGEQRRIASVLWAAQRAIERQERLIALTEELKKALMHQLFTEGTRAERQKDSEIGSFPESWYVEPLGEHLLAAQYGLSVKGANTGGVPILRMTNQIDGRIVADDLQFVTIAEADFLKFRLERGDILFNRTNSFDLVGRTAIFELAGDFVFASYLIRLRTRRESLRPSFLNHLFNWRATQVRLKEIATRAVSQSNISASRLRRLLIPLPPPEEQDKITLQIDSVERAKSAHRRRLLVLRELFRTLLHELMTAQVRVHDLDLSALEREAAQEPVGVA